MNYKFTEYAQFHSDSELNDENNAIVRFTPDGTIIYANPAYSVYHYLSGKIQSSFLVCVYDYFSDFTRKKILDLFEKKYDGNTEYSIELHFSSPTVSGPILSDFIIDTSDGNIVGVLVMPLVANEQEYKNFNEAQPKPQHSLKQTKNQIKSLGEDEVAFFHAITEATTILMSDNIGEGVLDQSLSLVQDTLHSNAIYITQILINQEYSSPLMIPRYEYKDQNLTVWTDNTSAMTFDDLGLSRWYMTLARGEIIVGNTVDFSSTEAEVLQNIGLQSIIVLPLFIRGVLWGFVEYDYYEKDQLWTDARITVIKGYTAAIGNYIVRVQDNEMLKSFTEDLFEAKKILESQANDLAQKNYELEIAREEADNANKTKSSFLSSMSHELRTPLNAIIGFSQILQKDKTMPEQFRSSIDMMYRSGTHLLDMINDILDLSKIEAGKMEFFHEVTDLYALLDDIYGMFSLRCKEKDLWLKIVKPDELSRFVITDAKRLKQVLINFIGNSVKFTQKGGISVVVESIYCEHGKTKLLFSVIDTGRGIPKEQCASIFEPFQQVKGTYSEGTGLGLAICQKIVKMMGSEGVNVSSELGQGSTFYFSVEFLVAQVENSDTRNNFHTSIIGIKGHRHIVVVVADKSEINRAVVKGFLEPIGFTVYEAATISSIFEIISTNNVDGIIADFGLFHDYPFAQSLLQQKVMAQHVPVIVISANALTDNREIAAKLGFDEFVPKPFHEKQLLEAVAKAIHIEYLTDESSQNDVDSSVDIQEKVNMKDWLVTLGDDVGSMLYDAIEIQDFDQIRYVISQLDPIQQQHSAVTRLLTICSAHSYKDIIEVMTEIQ